MWQICRKICNISRGGQYRVQLYRGTVPRYFLCTGTGTAVLFDICTVCLNTQYFFVQNARYFYRYFFFQTNFHFGQIAEMKIRFRSQQIKGINRIILSWLISRIWIFVSRFCIAVATLQSYHCLQPDFEKQKKPGVQWQ